MLACWKTGLYDRVTQITLRFLGSLAHVIVCFCAVRAQGSPEAEQLLRQQAVPEVLDEKLV